MPSIKDYYKFCVVRTLKPLEYLPPSYRMLFYFIYIYDEC